MTGNPYSKALKIFKMAKQTEQMEEHKATKRWLLSAREVAAAAAVPVNILMIALG